MTTITIRQLHDATGRWIRKAADLGELQVTERGRVVAKLLPASAPAAMPYFAVRKLSASFRSAKLRGGRDSTIGIGEERDHLVP
jgi:antitoxin (DNA-binding transcriptional repressor) of toxin-antitoxin stability system